MAGKEEKEKCFQVKITVQTIMAGDIVETLKSWVLVEKDYVDENADDTNRTDTGTVLEIHGTALIKPWDTEQSWQVDLIEEIISIDKNAAVQIVWGK